MNSPDLERKTAGDAIRATDQLAQCPAFEGWFLPQLRGIADELADRVLHEEMTAEQREIHRQKRLSILEVLALPAEARMSAEGVLGGEKGVNPEEHPE